MTAAQESSHPDLLADLNLGLIGAGPWGRNYIRTLQALDGVTLSRLASRNPESPALAGPDCRVSTDWRQLIEAGDLDGVIIASPPPLHAEMTLAAIEMNLPVLVEKPMTMSAGDADAVMEAAGSKDSIVLVDHIHLYSAAWEALKREAQTLGPLRALAAVGGKWGMFRADTPVLWDWASHYVALGLDLTGRQPETALAKRVEARDVEDTEGMKGGKGETLALELRFGDVAASIAVSNLYPEKNRLFTAAFEGGELIYDDTSEEKLRLKIAPDDPGVSVPLGDGTPLERVVMAFRDAIFKKSPDMKDAVMGRDVVCVLAEMDRQLDRNML